MELPAQVDRIRINARLKQLKVGIGSYLGPALGNGVENCDGLAETSILAEVTQMVVWEFGAGFFGGRDGELTGVG